MINAYGTMWKQHDISMIETYIANPIKRMKHNNDRASNKTFKENNVKTTTKTNCKQTNVYSKKTWNTI